MSKKIVVISQDYDACFSIMTEPGLKAELHSNTEYWKDELVDGQVVPATINAIRQQYNEYLSKITVNATEVKVYVGSDRQSKMNDEFNSKSNGNGSVFPALQQLCSDRSTPEKPWIFEPLLMSDPLDPSQGRFGRLRGKSFERITKLPRAVQYHEIDPYRVENSKVSLLLTQMWDAYRQNPDATEIEFHFIDDNEQIMRDALKKITADKIPPNMTFFVSKFDYIGLVLKEPGALALKASIHGASSDPKLTLSKDNPSGFFAKNPPARVSTKETTFCHLL